MKILITGATGYLGGALADGFQRAGHQAWGLARTPEAEEQLRHQGWAAASGDLRNPNRLEELAAQADGVVHAGKVKAADAAAVDIAATRALLDGLAGSGKPLLYTSGIWTIGPTGDRLFTEEDPVESPAAASAWRRELEPEIRAAKDRGVRTVVIRPGVVYGRGGGLLAMLARGDLPVIGDGRQRWPLVHTDDLADLYLRALDVPPGSLLHAIDGRAAMIDLALAARVGAGAAAQVKHLDVDAARETLGAVADALALDQRVSAERTRRLTGWRPTARPVIEELLLGSYRAR